MDQKQIVFEKIKGGLIVSCQALESEPLHDPYIMSRMAYAAKLGGAAGIRANTVRDIKAIRQTVDLPMIGIIKKVYPDSDVFITPTFREAEELSSSGAEIIAIDATFRSRPFGESLHKMIKTVKDRHPHLILMADCSNYEEGIAAAETGFDCVGTTLCGYTSYTKDAFLPNLALMKLLSKDLNIPVIAEGGIWTPEQLRAAFDQGVFSCVVGTAITRPMEITKRFVSAIGRGRS